jgi:hypothetical protein
MTIEQAYRLGAMDSKELSLSDKETKAVLSGTHARLLLPLVLPQGDFHDERKAQVHIQDRQGAIRTMG